ncbi:MAG TPA: signal peptidase I [Polyangia bacterium]|nr:signal peptidase I [Polyangia bacterium]
MVSREQDRSSDSSLGSGPEPRPFVRAIAYFYWSYVVLFITIGLVVAVWVGEGFPLEKRALAKVGLFAIAVAVTAGIAGALRLILGAEFDEAMRRRRAAKEARLLCQETRRILRKHGYRVKPEIAREISSHEQALRAALASGDFEKLKSELGTLDELVDKHLQSARKSTVREYAESIGVAVLIALLLRSFVVEAFKIPSGSMIPTLKVGDHIFVNKFVYGLGYPLSGIKFWIYNKPKRGDVIVFKYPEDPDKDFIKRVIGVEGDTVEIRHGFVFLNGHKLPREHVGVVNYTDISDDVTPPRIEQRTADEYKETIDGRRFSIFLNVGFQSGGCPPPARYGCGEPITVPADRVFVMGDNRDNSHDSRFWGFVPDNYIKGKALFIWYSGDPTKTLPTGIRIERLGHLVR